MPNGGQIITPLKKIGDKFYLRYSDNDIQFAAAAFWLKPLEPMNVEDEKLIGNYLYAYPPYPLPAKDYVSSEIYWDTKLDINSADMSVYNLFGDKICGKEKISLQQKTIWSGTVTWDASSAPPGLYLLRIKHGTKTETIKMLIE